MGGRLPTLQRSAGSRTRASTVALFVSLGLSACTALSNPPVAPLPSAADAPQLYEPPVAAHYRIQVGDKLALRSYYDAQLNQDVTVREDGRISVLLLQDVDVVGKTPAEVATMLTDGYAKAVNAADLTVSLAQSAGSMVYVGGEVRTQAQQPLGGPLTLVQALTAAGGFLPTANKQQVLILRHTDDNQLIVYQVNTDLILLNKAKDVYLRRNDVVHVPLSQVGEVGRFVDLYINRIIPEALRFNAGYTWLKDTRNIQVATPP